jgi:M6 family metalloprotease-like protein
MKSTASLIVIAVVFLLPVLASAQPVAPAPGIEMPQGYFDRIAEDKSAFQFQKAWIQKAERAKQRRAEYFERLRAEGRPLPFSMASLPEMVRDEISVAGTINVPLILINYSNTTEPFTPTQIQQQIFDGPTTSDGTLPDLYNEMSFGALNVVGTTVGWVTATQADTYYEGGCNGIFCGAAKTGQLILEALNGVDGTLNFGQFDNDGPDGVPNSGDDDGFVDFVAIVHPETGGECGTTNMWSHRFVVTGWPEFAVPYQTNDARTGGGFIRVFDYTIQPARGSTTGCGTGINEIGVFAHEFGHAFGLPDFYDTDGGGQGIGEHGLMGSGNWQNPPNPAHMSAYSKEQLGWVVPQEVGPTAQRHGLAPVRSGAIGSQQPRLGEHHRGRVRQRLERAGPAPVRIRRVDSRDAAIRLLLRYRSRL